MAEQSEDGVSGRTTGSGDKEAEGEVGAEEDSATSGMARGSE